jgi:hypothetical protein
MEEYGYEIIRDGSICSCSSCRIGKFVLLSRDFAERLFKRVILSEQSSYEVKICHVGRKSYQGVCVRPKLPIAVNTSRYARNYDGEIPYQWKA